LLYLVRGLFQDAARRWRQVFERHPGPDFWLPELVIIWKTQRRGSQIGSDKLEKCAAGESRNIPWHMFYYDVIKRMLTSCLGGIFLPHER
jgi:hypothetical protein